MPLSALPLEDADLAFDPGWLPAGEADVLLVALRGGIPWEVHRIRLFGREIDSPRLSCWIGDADAAYAYSGARFQPHPWPQALRHVREHLRAAFRADFNSVLANRYRNGRDRMGWHSDNEPELGPRPMIASLSLGATRRFVLKHRADPARKLAIALPHGSLLLMRGDTQSNYRHALPPTTKPMGERINLTFRRIRR